VNAPPVVDCDIEDREKENEEGCGPLGLETNRNHDTGHKSNYGNKDSGHAPGTLKDESNEKENEENTTCKLEIFPAVCLGHARDASKDVLLAAKRITEDHEKPTDDREVPEEEIEVENQAVTETLDNDDTE